MNVLSLFDGMSGGQIALNRLGIKYDNYFAAEIDKYAIKITQKNFPDTIQLGSVLDVHAKDLPKIDLLIGGSPCQGFSFAGKQLNFGDERSKLFFEYIRLLKECTPKYFLLENVKMKKEYHEVITDLLGVPFVELNSALVSAQNRKRLYWTNIPGDAVDVLGGSTITQPEDKGILLKDIVHEHSNTVYQRPRGNNSGGERKDKSPCLSANSWQDNVHVKVDLAEYIVPFNKTLQILDKEVQRGKVGYFRKDSQANRVYYIHDKAVTLCGEAGGGAAKMSQYLFGDVRCVVGRRTEKAKAARKAMKIKTGKDSGSFSEREFITRVDDKTNCLTSVQKDNYLFGCLTPDRLNKRQNGQRFSEGTKFYTLTAQDKHGILIEGYIRKLTPIECERLQTVEDNYTEGVSNSQRYKMLGNGWTVDVIAHIFKNI